MTQKTEHFGLNFNFHGRKALNDLPQYHR